VLAALSLTALSACDPGTPAAGGNAWPDWWNGRGVRPCQNRASTQVLLHAREDVNNDGTPDWAYVFRCSDDAGDQVEVFDGKKGTATPERLGSQDPLVTTTDHIRIGPAGCLVFLPDELLVVGRKEDSGVYRVLKIGDWSSNVLTARPADSQALDCRLARPLENPPAAPSPKRS
jgi:hypothetical protein